MDEKLPCKPYTPLPWRAVGRLIFADYEGSECLVAVFGANPPYGGIHPTASTWASDDNAKFACAAIANYDALSAELAEARADRDRFVAKAAENMRLYLDLLMQVVHVVPGEDRHESAKRIIREHEQIRCDGPANAPSPTPEADPTAKR